MAKVIFDFKLQIELLRAAFDSNKDWKRTGNWAPVWYRLVQRTQYSIVRGFMKQNLWDVVRNCTRKVCTVLFFTILWSYFVY